MSVRALYFFQFIEKAKIIQIRKRASRESGMSSPLYCSHQPTLSFCHMHRARHRYSFDSRSGMMAQTRTKDR